MKGVLGHSDALEHGKDGCMPPQGLRSEQAWVGAYPMGRVVDHLATGNSEDPAGIMPQRRRQHGE